ADKPRYLMGVGTPLDILEAVHRGVDMFDCIMPTQLAQRGGVFTSRGFLQMRRGVYKMAEEKLDPQCACPTCARYSRAYLHHLTKSAETLGWQLLGQHNIYFYHQLMREIRAGILADRFLEVYREKRAFLHVPDLDHPITPAKPKKQRPTRLGNYEVHTAWEGFGSIRQISSGEIMHMRTPPMEEARQLYVEQARLAERLQEADAEPLVIWDVGLGAAANAMAAVQCYEALAVMGPIRDIRPMRLISFENDLDSLRLALLHNNTFPYLRHGGPRAILEKGMWRSKQHPGLEWQLLRGEFLQTMHHAPAAPDVIFYDMFSSKTSTEAWTLPAFRQLFAACGERATELFTYTCSTSVRVALLAAGFYVAQGRSMGPKSETTIALMPAAYHAAWRDREEMLTASWLEKWNRSGAKFPVELAEGERAALEGVIRAHPQFQPAGLTSSATSG
ncbi:MAG: tRNA-guanine transglycosylase, partial [Chthoniobacterales bacterium]